MYLIKCFYDYRRVYKVLSETDTHYEVSTPLFNHFGCKFARWSKPKMITKKYIKQHKFEVMDQDSARRYDAIQKGDYTIDLFAETAGPGIVLAGKCR